MTLPSQCVKVKFGSQAFADFYIKKCAEKYKVKCPTLKSYLCPFCLAWHVTHEEDDNMDDLSLVGIKNYRRTFEDNANEITKLQNKVKNLEGQVKGLTERLYELFNQK